MILTKQLRFLILSVLALIVIFLVLDWVVPGSNLLDFVANDSPAVPTGVVLRLNVRRVRAVGPIVFAATLSSSAPLWQANSMGPYICGMS